MRRDILFAGIAALAISSTSALAADLDYPAVPLKASPVSYSWTGCYLGAHVGGGQLQSDFAGTAGSVSPASNSWAQGGIGAVAGGQAGCNYQSGYFVAGVEGELYWSDLNIQQDFTDILTPADVHTAQVRNTTDATIAARAGFALDRSLFYGKLGVAWGWFNWSATDCCATGAPPLTTNPSATIPGLLLGAGFEYALWGNWTTKIEYDYINYGTRDVQFTIASGGAITDIFSETTRQQIQLVKLGLNYKFNNWFGP
jgi:outer membrane immunogenic protein